MTEKVFSLQINDIKWLFFLSYLTAIVIDNMMVLSFDIQFMPSLTLLTLFFWTTQILYKSHLFSAFILGLAFDTALNTPLGSHSLIFLTTTFLMLRSRLRFKSYPLWQQSIIIGGYILVFQIMSWFIFAPKLFGNAPYYYWLEPVIATLIWPLLTLILNRLTHKTVFN
ncbi:rod shape-determining protein MreD [Hydrogenovibrio sp. SC-1]|uniref:rod shape-determining protein MreD n=1 Tax=Hydrogenovibrio sp. SC-1 TaxID=2065820 RepID=UPI000C7CD08C|nr:rod shape-determining protein MreD [Hydrogenovibrio sp. SC-1]PLA75400.1 rod shape-determining protein MreD [Hydrogenovibrio sp. SC-1]